MTESESTDSEPEESDPAEADAAQTSDAVSDDQPSESGPTVTGEVDGRIPVYKTYKLYIDGSYPRTESGRYLQVDDHEGNFVANICHASRKDFRDAVVAAREALDGWFGRSAFNRGQILYRMGEMLEARRADFESKLREALDYDAERAAAEVETAIDRLVWYAGWADKFEQVFGSTNPVSSNHFNFTVPEPTGVISIFTPQNAPLLGLVSSVAPVIVSGNTAIAIVDNDAPHLAVEFAEILNNSDVPGGVVNILTSIREELVGHVGGHRDVDGIIAYGADDEIEEQLALEGAENVKRVKFKDDPQDWTSDDCQSPYWILPFVEFKTNWHPVGV